MTAIALLFFVISFSMIITRSAAVMLELTGMSRDSARFQSRAAYCGVGYSNRESEGIIDHPLRRRIISTLMLLGNAGTATAIATLILSFSGENTSHKGLNLALIFGGLITIYVISSSKWVDTQMTTFVQWALKKYSRLDLNDYVALLNLSAGYSVLEVEVREGDWLGNSDLATLRLPMEGVLVLGVRRNDGSYMGVPPGNTRLEAGDVLTVYGKLDRLEELNHRQAGVAGLYAHAAAITERKQEKLPDEKPDKSTPRDDETDSAEAIAETE